MSLINDALKRARDADRRRAAAPPDLTLQPVDPPARGNAASRWLVLVLILIALTLSLWSFSRWARTAPPQGQFAEAPHPPQPQPGSSIVLLPDPAPDPSLEPVSAPIIDIPTNTAAPEPAPSPNLNPIPEPPQVPEAATNEAMSSPSVQGPELILQSIIFRLRNPTVVINGQMLQQGDTIADAQILDIERHRVTLRRNDSNLVLTLPAY